MFTLQILDRGQTFLHPLDDRPLLVGSGEAVGLRLAEAEVVERHARFEPRGDSVRLVAMAKVLVNGRAVMTKVLELGDRIEIGKAVLVFGRSVARPAQPEDVLEDVRGRVPRVPARRGGRVLAITAGLVMLGAVAVFATMSGGDASTVQSELAMIRRARQAGDVERASASLARLRRQWSEATDDRLQRLQAEQHDLDQVNEAAARLTAAVLDPAVDRSYAQWLKELQRLESEGADAERVGARLVRSSLRETLNRRPKKPWQAPVEEGPRTPAVAEAGGLVARPAARDETARVVADADRLVQEGLFAQAMAMLQAEIGQVEDAAAVTALQDKSAAVRAVALRAVSGLVAESQRLGAAGKPREAATALVLAQHRFPAGGEFAPLAKALGDAEAAIAAAEAPPVRPTARPEVLRAVDETARAATLTSLRAQLDRIRDAEERADFATALPLLREGAVAVRERDADFAARLEIRAAEAELLVAWHECVAAALRGGKPLEAALRTGRIATLSAVDGPVLLGRTSDGDVRLSWHDVSPRGVAALAEQVHASQAAALGAATLLYKVGEAGLAEPLLAKLLRADPAQKEPIDRVLARGRGDRADPRGYVLGKDGFVSVRSIESKKEAQKLAARLDTALRAKDRSVRDAFLTEVMAHGPDALEAVVGAFQKEFKSQLAKLDSGALKKQVDRLAAQRDELDKARQFAKDLIYDEVKYFYPYKPPAVSGEKFAEYNRVQAEVDRRVAAVREIWNDDRLHIKVPASLQSDLDRLDWVAGVLADLGELDAESLQRIAWARALPIGDSIGIADYCRTPTERAELEEWRAIEAFDRTVECKLPAAAREQLHITNDYRAMFRHRPLALALPLCTAAQGHADEMSRLGYFAHMSPTPGRRTPYDRMKLAGYSFGASENIALHDSAMGAHVAWCHSSGHHRNLLNPHHREFGIGAAGRDWVQNFGSGRTFQDDPAWTAAPKKRPGHR